MKLQYLKKVVVALIGISFLSVSSCIEDKKTVKPIVITFKKEGELLIKKATNDSLITKLDIEIADTDYETQTGMMYRDSMKDSQGMLFVFPDAKYHSFYMKNTRIPLDIIYLNADKKIVSIHKNAQPFNETSLPSEAPAQYVLEINGGLSDFLNLEIGDLIEYSSN